MVARAHHAERDVSIVDTTLRVMNRDLTFPEKATCIDEREDLSSRGA
jgi:hypothetical protein